MKRIAELDAVRGIAAVVIVIYHVVDKRYLFFGWAALDLFFVLSGFLITSIIIQARGDRWFLRKFYFRRNLRIWPIYYITLAVFLAVNPLLSRPYKLGGMRFYLTYTQNICQYFVGMPIGQYSDLPLVHTWTLAVEEQYYLFWPALLLIVGPKRLVGAALTVALCSVTVRALGYGCLGNLFGRSDGFAMGGLLAAFVSNRSFTHSEWSRSIAVLSSVGLVSLAFILWRSAAFPYESWDQWKLQWPATTLLTFNLLFASAIGIVILNEGRPALSFLRGAPLVYLGRISYGIYLYHMIVLRLLIPHEFLLGESNAWLVKTIAIALSLLVAAASWKFVEQPILALKNKFDYRGEGSAASIPQPSKVDLLKVTR